jgi:hypothetical protein
LLIVGARCEWHPEGPDRNAVVYGPNGDIERVTVGDGVAYVLSTPKGDFWVGYSDEGVYGNYGWGGLGPTPIGTCGIARFNSLLVPVWQYSGAEQWGAVDDCEALNVVGEDAWACYYSDSPVVCIAAGAVRGWKNAVGGARALLVHQDRAALVGGYGKDHDRYLEGVLGKERFEPTTSSRVVLPDGEPLPCAAQLVGRGSELQAFFDNTWYKLNLE